MSATKNMFKKLMKREATIFCLLFLNLVLVTSCSYNPFISNNHLTGSPVAGAVGTGVGAGSFALVDAPKPWIVAGGVAGGMFGYYVTTLRHDAGPIIRAGGNVYQLGQMLGIYLPSDSLFETNTADLLPQASTILDAAIVVLQRYPNNNIVISGNTSGFYQSRYEQRLSEQRARVVSAYLWRGGISEFRSQSTDSRKLNVVGYGDYFPIANYHTDKGIRTNSRLQITSYPTDCDLHLDQKHVTVGNIGVTNDSYIGTYAKRSCDNFNSDGSCKDLDDSVDARD